MGGIQSGVLRIDVLARRAKIWGDGSAKWSATNLLTVGLVVKNALLVPEHAANRYLFTALFTQSSNEVLAALENATGKEWDVKTDQWGRWRRSKARKYMQRVSIMTDTR